MTVALLIILTALSIYTLGTILFIKFANVQAPRFGAGFYDASLTLTNREEIAKVERELKDDPSDQTRRIQLMQSYRVFGDDPAESERAFENSMWICEHRPDLAIHPFCSNPFMGNEMQDRRDKVLEIWQANLAKSNRDPDLLRNASIFFTSADSKFALRCCLEVLAKEPLNPRAIAMAGTLENYAANPGYEKRGWEFYRKSISLNWTELEFGRLEYLKRKFGKFLWPHPIAHGLLFFQGLLRKSYRKSFSDFYELATATDLALNAGDNLSARKMAREIHENIDFIHSETQWFQFLHHCYNAIVRVAIRDKDQPKIDQYLALKSKLPIDSEFNLLHDDRSVTDEFIDAGRSEDAYAYVVERTKDVIKEFPKLQDDIDKIKLGIRSKR